MAAADYYEDERLAQVKAEEQQEMTDVNNVYNNAINKSDDFYNAQIEASKDWADKQQQIQQENTDFAIEKIEQQREQAQKDYTKEQSGAYVDYKKQSNQYGANAEQMAANGLTQTGYSESSQVSMYTTYQNRVAAARESISQANINFDNAITEARLSNDSNKAQIAYQAFQQQLALALEGFQYKNSLLMEQLAQQQNVSDRYHSRYQDVLAQINQEKAFAYQQDQDRIAANQWQKEYDIATRQMQLEEEAAAREAEYYDSLMIKDGEEGEAEYTQQYDTFGNSAEIVDKEDYYFSNGYQPRYINGTKLEASGMKSDVLPDDLGIPSGQNIWKADGQYYAWSGALKTYINVTEDVVYSNGYQPKYIGKNELESVGTIKGTIGSYGNLPGSQNVWKAGNKYYVWNGKTKSYEDVTKEYTKYQEKWSENYRQTAKNNFGIGAS